jgi:hypothetical protein
MASSSRRPRAGGEVGVETRDALRGLALQFETGAFVDARERDRRARREAADAASEALRTYQMCASPKLSREENLELVLRPVLRTFCARLLARLGRVADRGVDADAARAARGVALELERAPGRDGELELMAAIERRLERIAEDVFAGRCGVAACEADAPDDDDACAAAAEECASALSDALRPRENVDNLVTPRVLGFAQRVAYASEMSRGGGEKGSRNSGMEIVSGDVPGEVVQIAVEVCEALAVDAERLERDDDEASASAGSLSGLGAFPFGIAALTALARLGSSRGTSPTAAEEADARNRRAVARLRRAISERLPGALRRAAPRVRAAAAEAAERAERRRAAAEAIRRDRPFDHESDDVRDDASDSVRSSVHEREVASAERNAPAETETFFSPDADARRLDPPARSRDVFAITRAEACFAVRACGTPEECRATLAEQPVRAALAPVAESLARAKSSRAPAPAAGNTVSGEQVVKDWLREGDGLTVFVDARVVDERVFASSASRAPNRSSTGSEPPRVFHASASVSELGPGFAGLDDDEVGVDGEPPRTSDTKLATGPFQAHFVSACGALADALLAAGTCRGVRGKRKTRVPREVRAATAREAAKQRWLEPPPARRGGDDDDEEENRLEDDKKERAACAAAAARVMLAGSRTVRGGDALEFVMRVFAGDDEKERARAAEWTARSVDPAVSDRVLRPAGPSASARVSRARVVVTARDVFVVSRVTRPPDDRHGESPDVPVPWAAVATRTTQTLVFDAATERLELASRAVGLDPDVSPLALDGFLRELLLEDERLSASKRGVPRTKTVGPRGFDDETAAAAVAAAAARRR